MKPNHIQEALSEAWNSQYPTGTPVIFVQDDGSLKTTMTISFSWIDENDDAVIYLEGMKGRFSLSRIIPISTINQTA